MLHESGIKAQRDRSMLIASYRDMVKEFRIPRKDRITADKMSKLTNKQLYQACKDLYNGVTIKQARKYGIKRGFIKKPAKKPFLIIMRNLWRKVVIYGKNDKR
jgi:hypothetical protein